ncbi:Fibronectin type III domain-containing protein 3B [Labeo rohita]|uniref:Fibronectin type III domain-containing protein 3B n=1 Tax=Labeo rohita TaxID=84645 RepID=A0ABQ8LG30_LABRO|nr:Fibronectin type III domain-containing protein 3B [Labeo rohita]
MMMTDQMLDLPPPLSNEVPMMHHMINGDAPQQVILVQVNPGETFTIRTEDGALQCIQGLSNGDLHIALAKCYCSNLSKSDLLWKELRGYDAVRSIF